MIKIIVTGGAGFIGSHIVDSLVFDGYDVHIVDNMYAGKEENINENATFHNVDIRDSSKLNEIFKDAVYVFHEAALPQVEYSMHNPIETHEINVTGLLNVLEACRLNKVKRLVFAASSASYGNQEVLPLVENMEPRPLSPYGAHKLIGEFYCSLWSRVYNLETVCLRYFNVYGPRQSSTGAYASVVAKFMDLKKSNQSLTVVGDGEQTRSYVHVSDIVKANIKAMSGVQVGKGEVINIGTNEMHSVNTIAKLIGGDIVYIDPRIEPRATSADISKAKEMLDWEPMISLEDGIKELKNI